MSNDPVYDLMSAGKALKAISKELIQKEEHGLAYILKQIGCGVCEVGEQLDEEGWDSLSPVVSSSRITTKAEGV